MGLWMVVHRNFTLRFWKQRQLRGTIFLIIYLGSGSRCRWIRVGAVEGSPGHCSLPVWCNKANTLDTWLKFLVSMRWRILTRGARTALFVIHFSPWGACKFRKLCCPSILGETILGFLARHKGPASKLRRCPSFYSSTAFRSHPTRYIWKIQLTLSLESHPFF